MILKELNILGRKFIAQANRKKEFLEREVVYKKYNKRDKMCMMYVYNY